MEVKKYRVEAFIIPSNCKNKEDPNQIDDVKLANKLKDQSFTSLEELKVRSIVEEAKDENLNDLTTSLCSENRDYEKSSSEFSEVFFEINEHIYDEIMLPENKKKNNEKINHEKENNIEYTKAFFKIDEPIYDEPFVGNLIKLDKNGDSNIYDVPQTRWTLANSKYRRFGIVAPKLPKRSSSLMSIVEDIETLDDSLLEICSHGRKNGCMISNERPEDISEDIFKENWMQRLDALRKLEMLLKDKEIALQSRERLLFKKEKELRILERLVKDKMKQAELYAKRYKKSLSSESVSNNERNLESRSSNCSKDHIKSESLSNASSLELKNNSKVFLGNQERSINNPPNSKCSSTTDRLSNRIGSVRSRSRPRQKIRYDDLDSTLSADIGDSSFIVTSKKFDPMTFKKPAAFVRSVSERRPKIEPQVNSLRLDSLLEKNENASNFPEVIEGKTLKKISENILASQNQETKFLNYGLIDKNCITNDKTSIKEEFSNQKRFSYLNLESVNNTIKSKMSTKDRPSSWSEDADDWLKKKRQAYNLSIKKTTVGNLAEKENFEKELKTNKSLKITKKKEKTQKKFSIFR